ACVIAVSVPVVRSIRCTSPGASGLLMTAAPRFPSVDTDSMRPDQSPAAMDDTAPVATSTRYAAPRARTLAPKTIDRPSGDHAYCPILPLKDPVIARASPPSAGMTHSFSSASSHDVSLGARYEIILP